MVSSLRVSALPNQDTCGEGSLAVDPTNDEIFVWQDTQVMVYPRTATDLNEPLRTICIGDAGINRSNTIRFDAAADELYVRRYSDVAVYERTASGTAQPKRVIVPAGRGVDVQGFDFCSF